MQSSRSAIAFELSFKFSGDELNAKGLMKLHLGLKLDIVIHIAT